MAETKWERCIRFVLFAEAGWANNPNDEGGETFRGIARNFHGTWQGWPIVDQMKSSPDFPQNVNFDPKLKGMAMDFFKANFWNKIHGDELPEKTAVVIFDMAVNSDTPPAVKLLQSVLGIKCDGIVGSVTIKTAHQREEEILPWLFFAREDFYLSIIKKKPSRRVFAVTWFTRLQELRREVLGFGPPPLALD